MYCHVGQCRIIHLTEVVPAHARWKNGLRRRRRNASSDREWTCAPWSACLSTVHAGVAQLVEHELPKLEVAGSNPVARSTVSSEASAASQGPSKGSPSRDFFFQGQHLATTLLAIVVVGGVVGASGCERSGRVPVTIVVDTDRTRTRQEQDRLHALRSDVQGDRRELEGARDDLLAARHKLVVAAGSAHARTTATPGGGEPVTHAELQAELAALEGRLAALILARGDSAAPSPIKASETTPSATSPSATSPADPIANARLDLAKARDALGAKGLVAADVQGGVASVDRILSSIERGDGEGAAAVAAAFLADANAVGLTRPVLIRKYERINTEAKRPRLREDKRRQAEALLRSASQALSAGGFAEANAHLNAAAAAIGP